MLTGQSAPVKRGLLRCSITGERTMADEQVAVVEGPKGKAEIIEVWAEGRLVEYRVWFNGNVEVCAAIGMAYILAGEKAGVKT
jgi:hypothetical protein